jgi:hypothetical protein
MPNDLRLEFSLLLIRLATAAFLLMWAIDKVVNPGHAQGVFSKFYFWTPSTQVLLVFGIAQIAIVLAFAAGFARAWSYGAVLAMHTVSTASTTASLLNPWAPGAQLLFWTAVPVLAAMIALFLLRDRDRLLSVDAARSA